MATIGDRLAQKPAIVHDIDKIAQPNDETGDRDVGPAGIHVQRRLNFIKRCAQTHRPSCPSRPPSSSHHAILAQIAATRADACPSELSASLRSSIDPSRGK